MASGWSGRRVEGGGGRARTPPSRPPTPASPPSPTAIIISLLSLYRRVRRAHAACLPPPLRALGDATARSEWAAMVAATPLPTEAMWRTFAGEWVAYVDALTAGGASGDLPPATLSHMNEDQRAALAGVKAQALAARGRMVPGEEGG